MLARLIIMIVSALASYACIYALLSIVCYISDHDRLVMLHMYSSPVILSLAFGLVFFLGTGNQPAFGARVGKGTTPLS